MVEPLRHRYRAAVADTDVAWVVQLYHSHDQLAWFAPHLRRHFPRSRVVLISDGDGQPYADLARQYGFRLVVGDHLMALPTCHRYVTRLLDALLDGPEEYLFRIDPDAQVWRPFRRLPAFTALFGTLETVSEGQRDEITVPANVQGGCLGLTRDAAEEIRASGVLTYRSCAVDYAATWARCADMRSCAAAGTFCDDFVLSWAAHQRDVPIIESAEIRSRHRRRVENPDLRYAVTHPHKLPPRSPGVHAAPGPRGD